VKKPRAKPIYAYAIKADGNLQLESMDHSKASLVRYMNRPAGESVVAVRISEMAKPRKKRRP
jgi:hypothetical protein